MTTKTQTANDIWEQMLKTEHIFRCLTPGEHLNQEKMIVRIEYKIYLTLSTFANKNRIHLFHSTLLDERTLPN